MDDIEIFDNDEKLLKISIQTIRIFSQYTGMEFAMAKCAMLIMKKEKKNNSYRLVDFAVPANHREKIKESKKYLDLAREHKKLWNMKLIVILIVIGAIGIMPKGLEKRQEELDIRGRTETKETIELWRSV